MHLINYTQYATRQTDSSITPPNTARIWRCSACMCGGDNAVHTGLLSWPCCTRRPSADTNGHSGRAPARAPRPPAPCRSQVRLGPPALASDIARRQVDSWPSPTGTTAPGPNRNFADLPVVTACVCVHQICVNERS